MAGSEHFSSQNLDLADWPVWRKLIDHLGSAAFDGVGQIPGSETSTAGFGRRTGKVARRVPTEAVWKRNNVACGEIVSHHRGCKTGLMASVI